MPLEIRQFFERYRDAFNALDGEAVATLYAVPSVKALFDPHSSVEFWGLWSAP
jgi:hypothetical protein